MLAILGVFMCTSLAVYEARRSKMFLNPMTLFFTVWGVILLFSKIQLYGLYETSNRTYGLILLGLVFFAAGHYGYLFLKKKYKFKISEKENNISVIIEPRYKLLYALIIICCIYYFIYLVKVMVNIDGYSLWAVQNYLRNTNADVISSNLLRALGSFVIGPVSFAVPIITVADFWKGKRDKKLIGLTVVLLLIKLMATANRTTLMIFLVFIAIGGIFKLYEVKVLNEVDEYKRICKWIKIIAVIGVIAFSVMTISRNLSVVRSLYLQIAIPPAMLDQWSVHVDNIEAYGYGMASLNGFMFPIFYIIQKIFGLATLPGNFNDIYQLIALTDSHWIVVGEGVPANAYVSIFWFMYVDARYIGIIIGMIAFGVYCSFTFYMMKSKPTSQNTCLYYMCMLAIFYSICRLQFALTNFVLALLFIIFVAYKRCDNHSEKMNLLSWLKKYRRR